MVMTVDLRHLSLFLFAFSSMITNIIIKYNKRPAMHAEAMTLNYHF